jgi:hypothetical protein
MELMPTTLRKGERHADAGIRTRPQADGQAFDLAAFMARFAQQVVDQREGVRGLTVLFLRPPDYPDAAIEALRQSDTASRG